MNYDGLQESYWQRQIERVEILRARIKDRAAAVPGRVVPEDVDLAIGEGRRLDLAVLFLDISGFSQRGSETSAEQDMILRVLNLFFTEMIKIAEDYGATVEKNTGDGLMAYFENAPQEPASKRALACALTMMATNEVLLRPILTATAVDPIRFRVSIDYGAVTVARLGAPRRFNANVAIGAAANFAAKMLAKANPGEIVLGASAFTQLPIDWRNQFCEIATSDTGWSLRASGLPYVLYRFDGHWAKLT